MLTCFRKAGVKTGPVTGQPPPVSSETTDALLAASHSDPVRQHEGGQDGGDKSEGKKIKSEKERMDPSLSGSDNYNISQDICSSDDCL